MVVLAAYDRIRQVEVKCEVPGGAAEGYVFSWEGVATQAATTRCPSRFVPPPRSGGGSSELVRMLAIRNLSVPHFPSSTTLPRIQTTFERLGGLQRRGCRMEGLVADYGDE